MSRSLFAAVLLIICISAASAVRTYRHSTGSRNSQLKSSKSPRVRSEVFENLFIIYDPSFLSIVWPKITNGVHVNIDLGCFDDLSVFYRALTEGNAWAYKTVDATGRYQAGFFQGSRLWLGSKELCFRLDNEYLSKSKNYKENILKRLEKDFNDNIQDWPPNKRGTIAQNNTKPENTPLHRLEYVVVQILLNITKFKEPKSYDISLGLCLPRSCSPDDVLSLINFSVMLNDNLKSNGSTDRTVKIRSLRQIEGDYDLRYDSGAVLIILVTVLLVALAILATILDVGLIQCLKSQSGSLSVNVQNNATIKFGDEKYNRDMIKVFVDLKKEKIANKETIASNKEALRKINVETIRPFKLSDLTPTITLDVMAAERQISSCNRCGKYRKQCVPKIPYQIPACTPPANTKNCATITNTEYRKRDNLYLNLLLSFSIKHNWKRIFNTKMANKDLAVVHLLRIFATFWVIFIHVAILVDYLSGDSDSDSGSISKYRVLTMGTLGFDTLFFASGMFSAHHFFYLSSRYTVRQLVSCGGFGGKILQFVCFVTNRAIRLLPPYVYTIFATAALSRVWRDTAATAFPEKEYDNCEAYWWRNVLYITLFYPRDEQCMQISWYLSTETILHVCSALICVALTLRRRPALFALNAVLLAAVATDVLKAFSDYHKRINDVFGAYESLIERPVARVAPYFMGVMAGWLVHVVDGRTRVSKMTSWCLWTVSVGTLVTSVVTSSLYAHWGCAWLHLCWPAALLWPAIACSTDLAAGTRDLLESAALAALSRLGYCSLLVHGLAARWLLLGQGNAVCPDFTCLWSYTAGTILLTEFGALLMALIIEMPFCCLLRRITDVLTS